jgi:hypothetical protein
MPSFKVVPQMQNGKLVVFKKAGPGMTQIAINLDNMDPFDDPIIIRWLGKRLPGNDAFLAKSFRVVYPKVEVVETLRGVKSRSGDKIAAFKFPFNKKTKETTITPPTMLSKTGPAESFPNKATLLVYVESRFGKPLRNFVEKVLISVL